MISAKLVATTSFVYLAALVAVAYFAERRKAKGRSIINNPYVYSLSIAAYLTSWTYYGSVGRAATKGLDFLTIYLGPTLIAFTWWFLLRKMIVVCKEQNIVSIADFISSRYGKSSLLGVVITVFAVLGIMPYIALQLKAVAHSFDLMVPPSEIQNGGIHQLIPSLPPIIDTAGIVAFSLALFAALFGARQVDTTGRHEGLVAAIALESVVKLLAFVSVGLFVTFGLFNGPGDIFSQFIQKFPERAHLLFLDKNHTPYSDWFTLLFISAMAFMFLPRQFHIMVIENANVNHIKEAMWRFPAYMFIINIFVIPIALGGLIIHGGDASIADYFVIDLPLHFGNPYLALFVFIGGISASAGMVMISSVALSTMVLNHIFMPIFLAIHFKATDYSKLLVNLKRLCIFGVIFLGYLYCNVLGESYALVNIGLVSFIAATQFAPALLGGLYWSGATRVGAICGLISGFIVWFYTLVIPSIVRSGWLHPSILNNGPFGIELLKPLELFGMTGLGIWSHALFWTLLFNLGSFLLLSLITHPSEVEQEQATKFVSVFAPIPEASPLKRISKPPSILEFIELMAKFIGHKQAYESISEYLGDREIDQRGSLSEFELPSLKRFTERTLAGSVGSAPARIIIENYLEARGSKMEDVFNIFGSVTLSRNASREQLSVLFEVARMVSNAGDLKDILDNILQLFASQFKFDLCVLRLVNDQRSKLMVVSQQGMSSAHLLESDRDINMDTYIGMTFTNNTPTVINDTDFIDRPLSAQVIHREGIKSLAHTPISIEGEPVGVLSAFSRSSKGIFTSEFMELFDNVAGQIGVAWRNKKQTERLISAKEQEKELQIAKNIQLGLLPAKVPQIQGVSIAGLCVPARDVGGDYYDYLTYPKDELDLVIADVSGHNIGAALIMAETRTFINAKGRQIRNPGQVMHELNEFFYQDLTRAELFITMFYLKFIPSTKEVRYASAGHNPPFIFRSESNRIEQLDAEGMILGIKKGIEFEEKISRLASGDVLILYTDGIIEAENQDGIFFGVNRLMEIVQENYFRPPEALIDKVLEQVRLFTGTHNFRDDISMVVLKIDPEVNSSIGAI